MRITTLAVIILALFMTTTTACGGKKYLPPPEERPGEMEQYNQDARETDERGRYNVDVPVQ